MARKLTYEEVKNFIEVESESGCKLLSEEYLGSRNKLKIQCKCSNEFQTAFSEFKHKNKQQCNYCSGIRWSYKRVKQFIEVKSESGCKLVSKSYLNSKEKINLQCRCGNIYETTFHNFRHCSKRQCNNCIPNKFMYEQIKDFIEVVSNSGCKLLSKKEKYENVYSKLIIKCGCNKTFETDFNQFKNMNKRQCNVCGWERSNEAKRYMLEDVDEYVKNNTDLTLISNQYNDCKSKLQFKCKRCDNLFLQTFDIIKHNGVKTCPTCAREEAGKLRRFGYESMKNFIENNSQCTLLTKDEDLLVTDRMTLICQCGEHFETTFQRFRYRDKRQCNKCGSKRISESQVKTHEAFVKEIEDIVGDEYIVVGDYINSKIKIAIKHNVCGHVWDALPNGFLSGRRCPKCNGGVKYTHEKYVNMVSELVGDEYTPVEEYKGGHVSIKLKHNVCGHIWSVRPSNFLNNGTRCPQCSESKGEQAIREYLEGIETNFTQEFEPDDLLGIGGRSLRFDFAISMVDKVELLLVEYDGIFHYEQQYDDDGFKVLQIHDQRKNQYCNDNNIPLLRIPYWEFDNIEQILEEWLEKHGVLQKDRNTA